MKEKFIITVTNDIEGCPIERYLDPICSNVVIGTNIFSDIAASFSDFFGGFSGTYKNKLESIYDKATASLKDKAISLGANAVVGFKVDFDEISGGGKSMFMISASGTACIVKHPIKEANKQQDKTGSLSQFALDNEFKRRIIIKSINETSFNVGSSINPEWKEFLCEHPQKEVIEKLIDIYIEIKTHSITNDETTSFITKYLSISPKKDVIDILYSKTKEWPGPTRQLIRECNLFSPSHVLNIAKNNPKSAIALLYAKTDCYQKEDLVPMKGILDIYDTLPNTGKVELVKGGFLSKDKEQFICEHGHQSEANSTYCQHCGINIKGLTEKQVKIIEDFRIKTEILDEFL